jgi:hypothetical protein
MTLDLKARLAELKAETDAPTAPAPAAPTFNRGSNLRPNKYGGRCARCNVWVEAEGGHINRDPRGSGWLVYHNGECPEAQRPVPPRPAPGPRPAPPIPLKPVPTTPEIRHGIYTVETDDGHATFKISHQADDANFAPGRDVIGVMTGSDNISSYTSVGFVNGGHVALWRKHQGGDAWWAPYLAKLIASPEDALEARHCSRCNRLLTNPDSWELGMGPECASR